MADIALFHSTLGVRPCVLDAADRLCPEGHVVVDQYDWGLHDYDEASESPSRKSDALGVIGGCQVQHADAVKVEHRRREGRFVQSAPNGGDQSSLHPDTCLSICSQNETRAPRIYCRYRVKSGQRADRWYEGFCCTWQGRREVGVFLAKQR